MGLRNSADRYGLAAQALHWAVVALLILQYTLANLAKQLPPGLDKLALLARHKSVGITILGLALLRIAWRWLDPPPPLPPMPRWQALAARASHRTLYLLLLLLPLVGWMMSSASNYPVSWFGWWQLPDLVRPDAPLKELLKDLHGILAAALATLATLHLAAALKHQFYDEDGALYRMLPWRR